MGLKLFCGPRIPCSFFLFADEDDFLLSSQTASSLPFKEERAAS